MDFYALFVWFLFWIENFDYQWDFYLENVT